MSKMLWIIGKNGVVASALKKACEKLGLDFLQTSSHEVDVTSLQAIQDYVAQHHLGYIINCSAYTAVDTAEQEKDKARVLNVEAVKNLTQVCREKNIKLIHYSTDYVFEGTSLKPYLETDPVCPVNIYGQTKEQGERWIVEHDPKALVIRTSWVFSSFGHSFIRAMVRLMLKEQKLYVCDDQIGKATSASDLAEATLEIKDLEGVFHFANEGIISRYQYAQEILKVLEDIYPKIECKEIVPIKTALKPGIAKRPSYSALDTKKIQHVLSKPIASYKEDLKKVIPLILEQELAREQ